MAARFYGETTKNIARKKMGDKYPEMISNKEKPHDLCGFSC
jgi:hypothetical protein